MTNIVERDIPEQILKITRKEVFQGNHYKDGAEFKKVGSNVKLIMDSTESKLADPIHDVLIKCRAHNGVTVSFHHRFRDRDKVVNMVVEEIRRTELKDITICVSSLGKTHALLVPVVEDGTATNIKSSGIRGAIGEAISQGKLKSLAIMHSRGGRVRAIITGEVHINIAFIDTPACDDYRNCRGIDGKADYSVLPYSHADGNRTDKVVAITDYLVPFPNYLTHVPIQRVDYVCVVDEISDPAKVATGAVEPTTDRRKPLVAEYCTQAVVNTPLFKDGFSYQTGIGGVSIASTISLTKIMEDRGIKMGFGVGDLTKPMCGLLERGMVRCLLDTQDFDLDAIRNVKNPNHFRISAGAYASLSNKGSFVNKLDYVIPAALEVDVNFNCNVVVGSDGAITGTQGGHSDTAAGAKCTTVLAPLLQGRIPAIYPDVATVTAPGESTDIMVTDYGVAVNPRRPDLLEALEATDYIPLKTIQKLRSIVYSTVREPEKVRFAGHVVGMIEARDGTIMDVARQIKPSELAG